MFEKNVLHRFLQLIPVLMGITFAVFDDTGISMLCLLNSVRILRMR